MLSIFFTVLAVLLAGDLLFNRWYFGTPVPLAFYIKAVHGYEDYIWLLNPVGANLAFFGTATLAIAAVLLFAHRRQLRLLLVFLVAAQLPSGPHLALTEVGIVGAAAPRIPMLDMAGLNNAILAHHFDMDYIFRQQPDLIWLPNYDYTRSYGIFCTDPRLQRDYTVISDAFLFGIAIRKQSPFYNQILAIVQPEFALLYPGLNMSHHQVRAVSWNPNPTHTIDSIHAIQP